MLLKFRDLDLRIYTDTNGTGWVDSVGWLAGAGEPVQLRMPDGDFSERVARFRAGEATRRDAESLGRDLFTALTSGRIATAWATATKMQPLDQSTAVRLRLDIRDPGLAALPWELARPALAGSRPLVLSPLKPVVRYSPGIDEPNKTPFPDPLRILVAVAEPKDRPLFDAKQILARVQESLDPLTAPNRPEVSYVEHLTLDLLTEQMSQGWDVVQVIGHGERRAGSDCLVLEDGYGRARPVDADVLADKLLIDTRLQLLIACACTDACEEARCDSEHLAGFAQAALQARVPAVVAMQSHVTDVQMAAFSEGFYQSLAVGEQLEFAMMRGRHAIQNADSGQDYWASPVLYSNSGDGMLFTGAPSDGPVYQVPAASFLRDARPERPVIGNLPWQPPSRMVRRDELVREIHAAVCGPARLVVLRGDAGCGASSLALEVARESLAQARKARRPSLAGVVFTARRRSPVSAPFPSRLEPGWSAGELRLQLTEALRDPSLSQAAPAEQWSLLRGVLGRQRYLVVIDGLDELRGLTPADLLDRLPEPTVVLASSHACPEYGDAQVREVPIPPLTAAEARRFALEVAEQIAMPLSLVPDEEGLAEALGPAVGAPFAVRLLIGMLADGAEAADSADGTDAGQRLRNLIEQSLQRLTAQERETLALAALHPEPVTIAHVAGMHASGETGTRRCLARLETLGLVSVEPGAEAVHISSRIRREVFDDADPAAAERLIRGAIDYDLAVAVEERAASAQRGRSAITPERARNLLWAADQAYRLRAWEQVIAFNDALHDRLHLGHLWNEGIALGGKAYDAADRLGDDEKQAWNAIYPVGRLYFYRNELDEARVWFERALDKFQHLGHRHGAACAERYLGRVFEEMGFLDEAERRFHRGYALAAELTPLDVRGHMVAGLAHVAELRGNYQEAQRRYDEALTWYRAAREEWGIANTEHRLGRITYILGDLPAAEEHLNTSLDLFTRIEVADRRADVLVTLAEIAESKGDLPWARTYLNDAAEILEQLPASPLLGEVYAAVAHIAALQKPAVALYGGGLSADLMRLAGEPITTHVRIHCPVEGCPEPEQIAYDHRGQYFKDCPLHRCQMVEVEE